MDSVYKLKITPGAAKYITKVDRLTQERIALVFEELSGNPIQSRNVRKLKGYKNYYRYRLGDIRIVYKVDKGILFVTVVHIGPRGDIYKYL